MHSFVLDGETVKLRGEFRGFEGGHIDPDNLVLTVKNVIGTVLLETSINDNYRESAGIYCYDFLVPRGTRGELTYEFLGNINEKPIVVRGVIEVVGEIIDTSEPTLYGV